MKGKKQTENNKIQLKSPLKSKEKTVLLQNTVVYVNYLSREKIDLKKKKKKRKNNIQLKNKTKLTM